MCIRDSLNDALKLTGRCARSTAAKYSSGATLGRCLGCLGAALTCSTSLATTLLVVRDEEAAGSNPVTPTNVCAVQRPLPELVRASLAASTAAKNGQYSNKPEL